MRKFIRDLSDGRKALQGTRAVKSLVELDDEKREQLQRVLLDIYKDIAAVYNENGLIPFLSGGSALGAIRHKGFIPWDDDMDVAMTREDYSVFHKAFSRKYRDKYILNAPNYCRDAKTRFVKVMKKGTVCREIIDSTNPDLQRIAVDIFWRFCTLGGHISANYIPTSRVIDSVRRPCVNLRWMLSVADRRRETQEQNLLS